MLDYVEAFDRPHDPAAGGGLSDSVRRVSARWRGHEDALAKPLLDWVSAREDLRLLGPQALYGERHRCPTIAFSPSTIEPIDLARALVSRGVQTSSGHYYAVRVLDGVGIDPDRGVVRLSSVHYTSTEDVERSDDQRNAQENH